MIAAKLILCLSGLLAFQHCEAQGKTTSTTAANGKTITVTNNTSQASLTIYMGFVGNTLACYTKASFQSVCTFNTDNPWVCQMTVANGSSVNVNFNQSCQVSVAFTAVNLPWGSCPTSLAEFTLNGAQGDTLDVSLVNGLNYKININAVTPDGSSNPVINMNGAQAPYNTILGVYPPGCDICSGSQNPPTWPGCPGKQPCNNCQSGTQYKPIPGCQVLQPTNSNSYSVIFNNS